MQDSHLHFSNLYILVHRPVAHTAVQRTVEACELIFFKTIMADFGNAVTAEQSVEQVLRLAGRYQPGRAGKAQVGADKMQAASGQVAVFCQVTRVRIRHVFKALGQMGWRVQSGASSPSTPSTAQVNQALNRTQVFRREV